MAFKFFYYELEKIESRKLFYFLQLELSLLPGNFCTAYFAEMVMTQIIFSWLQQRNQDLSLAKRKFLICALLRAASVYCIARDRPEKSAVGR